MTPDTLYINGQQVELTPGTQIAVTRQIGRIADVKNAHANLTNTFEIPLTGTNRGILDNAEQTGSETEIPYTKNPGRFIRSGTDIRGFENGYAVLEHTGTRTASLTMYGGNLDLAGELEGKSLRDLDMSAHDHTYDLTTVLSLQNATTGVAYPVIDFGINAGDCAQDSGNNITVYRMQPCVHVHTLMDQIFTDAGFTKSGEMFSDPRYLNMQINTVDKVAGNADRLKASARPTSDIVATYPGSLTATQLNIPLATPIYDPQGVIRNNGGIWEYLCTGSGIADFRFKLRYRFIQGQQFAIELLKNNVQIAFQNDSTLTPSFLTDEDAELVAAGITMAAGDTIRARVTIQSGTYPSGDFSIRAIGTELACTFVQLDQVALGSEFPVAPNLPDIKQIDFIKAIMAEFGVVMDCDPATREVRFRPFDLLNQNIPMAPDWSSKIQFSKSFKLEYRENNIAQRNLMRYQPDDSVTPGYGDGVMVVQDETLPVEADLFTLPFAASQTVQRLGGYDVLHIPLTDASGKIQTSVKPRIFCVKVVPSVPGGIEFYDQLTPSTTVSSNVAFAYFSETGGQYNIDLQTMQDEYYQARTSILNHTKILTDQFDLTIKDTNDFDHMVPVWINVTSREGITVQGYWFVEQISNFISGKPTVCRLYRI